MGSDVRKIESITDVGMYDQDFNTYPIFKVMSYQRGYRWDKERAKQLIDDIYRNYKRYYNKIYCNNRSEYDPTLSGYEYCIQPLVLKEIDSKIDENGTEHKVYNVIDGQQRLTTLYLLFNVLNRKFSEISSNHKDDVIHISYKRNDDSPFSIDKIGNENEDDKELSIDERYAREVYNCILTYIDEEVLKKEKNYFGFTGKENNQKMNNTDQWLKLFREMIMYNTTIIWYEPNGAEEEAFDVFNEKKIPLTGSELVKALFMNPDNYIGSDNSYSNDLIKTRQIVIGNEWDHMEQKLHDPDFWHFFPHAESMNKASRMDALINMFVYQKLLKKTNGDQVKKAEIRGNYITDPQYAFQYLEKELLKELAEKSTAEKTKCMEKWWKELRELFNTYWLTYSPYRNIDEQNAKIYAAFHRISILQYIENWYFTNITRGSNEEKYVTSLEENYEYIKLMDINDSEKQRLELNRLIKERINIIWNNDKFTKVFAGVEKNKCDTISKKMRALVFDSTNILMRVYLMIHSLAELENNASTFARFSFAEFDRVDEDAKKWIFEHIFARGTEIKDDFDKILGNINNCKWKEYIEFKYEGILPSSMIKDIIDIKQAYINEGFGIDGISDDKKRNEIWSISTDYSADTYIPEDNMFLGFFKDNSLGNMGLIRKGENSSVGNKIFKDKRNIIMNKFKAGSFIPSGTYCMFTGAYCDEYDTDLWYPCHRLKYFKEMIEKVEDYITDGVAGTYIFKQSGKTDFQFVLDGYGGGKYLCGGVVKEIKYELEKMENTIICLMDDTATKLIYKGKIVNGKMQIDDPNNVKVKPVSEEVIKQ